MLPTVARKGISTSSRMKMVRRWAGRCLGSTRHEARVAAIASRLFKLTAHLHHLDHAQRRLLVLGAFLHDIGRCEGARKHHIRGAKMIRRNEGLPLRSSERRALAYLARHHRGRVPEAAAERHLRRRDDRAGMRLILALLRAADTLDNRRCGSPTLVMRLEGRRLTIRCFVNDDLNDARRAYARRKKFRLLEDALGLRVNVRVDTF